MTRTDDAARRWDEMYRSGRYEGEPPVGFVDTIVRTLSSHRMTKSRGLYVGCGNGRNFVPLVRDSGLDLTGIDASSVAIEALKKRMRSATGRVFCRRIEDMKGDAFDYVIAIQVFQHGTERQASCHFESASRLLRDGGLLFVRANSASTQINLQHRVTERNRHGGFTVIYQEGPKRGLDIHFFARAELEEILERSGLELVDGPTEKIAIRDPPVSGTWSQWELVAAKAVTG